MRSAPKHREIGFQETAGFGKIAGCLKNQGFWALVMFPEIRIWELSEITFKVADSQENKEAAYEKERLQRAL